MSFTYNQAGANFTVTVNLGGADEIVFVSTQYGGQILQVHGTTGQFTVVSGNPGFTDGFQFSPEGMVVGPDAKLYITDPSNGDVVRMNQNGTQPELVYTINSCDACPGAPQGPSFSSSSTGDLYFNTSVSGGGVFEIAGAAASTNGYPGTFVGPTNIIGPDDCDDCYFPGIGEGTGFDTNDNLLDVDQTNGILTVPPPYTQTSSPATLVSGLTQPTGVALDPANGQLYVSNTGTQQILLIGSGGTSNYFTFTTSTTCDDSGSQPDLPVFMQFDLSGSLFVVTTTATSVGGNGCGKLWRIDLPVPPATSPTATLLVDFNAAYQAEGEEGPLASPQAIGLALPPTQSTPEYLPLPANGGSVSAGYPTTCDPYVQPNTCIYVITGTWPAGIFENMYDRLEVIFAQKTQAEFAAELAGTNYGGMGIMAAPVSGLGGDTIVPSLQCINISTNMGCNDSVTQGTSYQMQATWHSDQASSGPSSYCNDPGGIMGGTIYFFRGEPAADVPFTSLANDYISGSCTDGNPGTKAQSSCTSSSSSSCASRWPNAYGPPTTPSVTAAIASPTTGATFSVNGAATTTFSCSPSTNPPLVSCVGLVVQPDGTLVFVSSGGALPTSQVGMYTLSVTPNVDSGSGASASVTYTVVACQDLSLSFNPSSVPEGTSTTVSVTLQSCNSKTEIGIVKVTVTAPSGHGCVKPLPFLLPVLLGPKPQTISYKQQTGGFCPGTYTVTAQTYNLNGMLLATTSSSLVVTAH